jgi:transposase InsO family protein
VERLIGSLRRECLDHVIVLQAQHLHQVRSDYWDYFHRPRPHRALDQDCPQLRPIEPPEQGKIVARPLLGGLHHRDTRKAA